MAKIKYTKATVFQCCGQYVAVDKGAEGAKCPVCGANLKLPLVLPKIVIAKV